MSKTDWISLIQLIQGANLSQREMKQFCIAFASEECQKFDQKFLLNGVHEVIADTIIIIIIINF